MTTPSPASATPRLRVPPAAELDAAQREVYDGITSGPRASGPQLFALQDDEGRLHGPFGPMLLSPAVGGALQALGAQIRYGTVLTARVRELAILMVAQHDDSAFERYAHEPVARHAGLSEDQLAALRAGAVPPALDDKERAAVGAVDALLRGGDLDDALYASAVGQLGERGLYELATLVGYYRTLALHLRVFRIGVPD